MTGTRRECAVVGGRLLSVSLATMLLMTATIATAGKQAQSTGSSGADRHDPARSQDTQKDIVVVGTPDGPFAVTVKASDLADVRVADAEAAGDAHFFSACVKPFDNGSLHELIDGRPNRGVRASALNRIIHGYIACYRTSDASLTRDLGTCNERRTHNPGLVICQAFFDRGALVEKVLRTYASDLSWNIAQLSAPDVLHRYRAREAGFNETRSKGERIFAEVAGCVVALHPQLALAFLRSDLASKTEDRMRATLLGTSPACVGGAKSVVVDPSQFRIFVADAVYSWAVAVRGTRSLVPYDPKETTLP